MKKYLFLWSLLFVMFCYASQGDQQVKQIIRLLYENSEEAGEGLQKVVQRLVRKENGDSLHAELQAALEKEDR